MIIWQKLNPVSSVMLAEKLITSFWSMLTKDLFSVVFTIGGVVSMTAIIVEFVFSFPDKDFFLSPEENIILCGKIDWLEYFPDQDAVHIIDFKTGKNDEDEESLQLPIYYLLVANCQKRKVIKASYWYIDRSDVLSTKALPDPEKSYLSVLEVAKKIKLARKLNLFKCPHKTGCTYCKPMEAILQHKAEFIGVNSMDNDVYMLDKPVDSSDSSTIL